MPKISMLPDSRCQRRKLSASKRTAKAGSMILFRYSSWLLVRSAQRAGERLELTLHRWPEATTLLSPAGQRLDEIGDRLPRALAARATQGDSGRYVAHVYRDRGDIAGCAIGILYLHADRGGSRAITEGDIEAACAGSAIEDQVGYRAH